VSRFLVSMAAFYFLFVSFYIVRSLLIVAAVVGKLLITFPPNVLVDDDDAHHGCWWLVCTSMTAAIRTVRETYLFIPRRSNLCVVVRIMNHKLWETENVESTETPKYSKQVSVSSCHDMITMLLVVLLRRLLVMQHGVLSSSYLVT
jgi:hypothetical protein